MKKHPEKPLARVPIVHSGDESLAVGLLSAETSASGRVGDTLPVIHPVIPVPTSPKRLRDGYYHLSASRILQQQALVNKVYGDSEEQQEIDDEASAELTSVFAPARRTPASNAA